MAVVAVSVSPVGGEVSVSRYVAAALEVLEGYPEIRYEVGSMFTTLEGDVDEIFRAVRAMQEAVFDLGALRVGTVIKVDDRRDKPLSMEGKLASVKRHREK